MASGRVHLVTLVSSPPDILMSHLLSRQVRCFLCAILTTSLLALGGCTRGHAVVARSPGAELAGAVVWFGPSFAADVDALARWRRSVGPPVIAVQGGGEPVADRLVVVNWNVHVGAGDVTRLFADVRARAGHGLPIVLLLQEVYRSGAEVPRQVEAGAAFASLIRGARRDGARDPIGALAARLGLHAYYVPSMRNGGAGSDEDRGNAILSTVPLADLHAIELPFERQRRVAVAATVGGRTQAGAPWRVRVVSAHLDTFGGARRLWLAGGELSRARQARGLVAALEGHTPMVLGADLNTWFGFHDSAYREAIRAFPQTLVTDRRATFGGLLRLDHLFFRLDDGWTASFQRAERSYGSDHYPLIGQVEFR